MTPANGEHVARCGALDIDRPGQRMDLVHVNPGGFLDGRRRCDLPAGCLVRGRLDDAAGRHPDGRFDQAAELVVRLVFRQYEVGLEDWCVGGFLGRGLGASAGQEHHEARG
jgi:hypothetical protein